MTDLPAHPDVQPPEVDIPPTYNWYSLDEVREHDKVIPPVVGQAITVRNMHGDGDGYYVWDGEEWVAAPMPKEIAEMFSTELPPPPFGT